VSNNGTLQQKLGRYSSLQLFFLALLRMVIGWHFLYEGYVKLTSSSWSAAGYLLAAPGPFAKIFDTLASTPWMINSIDIFMKYGLTLVGLALMLGIFTRLASVGAAALLLLFYFSNPPWFNVISMPGEGSYLIVNKNLVEFAAVMILLVFPSGLAMGFDRLFIKE
jgi:thiosulfate dehydrogenase [quinone] large subunit